MKRALMPIGLLLAACSPQPAHTENTAPQLSAVPLPMADRAGNRLVALVQDGGRWCSDDGAWCLDAADGAPIEVIAGESRIALPAAGENETLAPWPMMIEQASATPLFGVIATTMQGYSGGGGEASQLRLYRISAGAAHEVLRMPAGGSLTIRACFDEDDMRTRAEACVDEYAFVSRVSLDQSLAEGAPRIVLETEAGTYPGRLSRSQDSSTAAAERPLTQADLIWARDETCSYRRVYTLGADGLYMPDQPLPPCADYLEP